MSKSLGTSDHLLPGESYTPSYGTCDNSEREINSSYGTSSAKTVTSLPIDPKSKERIRVVARCALSVCLASLVAGMNIGFSSPALVELHNVNITPECQHFSDDSFLNNVFGSLGAFGAMLGGVAWPISDHYGRKAALIVGGIPSLTGWLLLANAIQVTTSRAGFLFVLFSGRLLTGFATGWSIFCASIYIAEISSPKLKGFFGNCNQLFITIGVSLTYLLGIKFGTFQFSYSNIALVAAGFVALFEILMLTTYETPRWLFKMNLDYEGIRILKIFRGPLFLISAEIDVIKAGLRRTYSAKEQLFEFKNRAVYHPFILVLLLMAFQQLTGINAATFYAAPIFKQAGYSPEKANIVTFVSVGCIQVISTLISVILVDYLGRRKLLIASSVGMAMSSLVLGIYYFIFEKVCKSQLRSENCPSHIEFVAIMSVVVFIVSFSLGWGPIPWSSMSELLPNRVRTLGGSVATFTNWFFAGIITMTFPSISAKVTPKYTWWGFAAMTVLSAVFVILFLPEAKGRTLEKIQEYFEDGRILACTPTCQGRRRKISPEVSVLQDASTYTPTSSASIPSRESTSVN